MNEIPLLNIVNVLTDLKTLIPYGNANVLLVGKTAIGDGLGGFYRWEPSATGADDAYLNTVSSSVSATGRWVRVFQKAKTVGGGILVSNGGIKTFFISGTTDANGKITLNLTTDNISTGPAIFSEIWSVVPNPQTNANGPASAVQSYRESMSADLKQTVYGFYKANALTIALGMLFTPVAAIGSGTTVQFRVEGI